MNSDSLMTTLTGLATARGFASGPVFVFRGDGEIPVPEYVVPPERVADELKRLEKAMNDTRRDLENLIAVLRERAGREDVRVFECHQMILEDELLAAETRNYIIEKHINAEAAVRKTAANARSQFARMNDSYFRERVRDLDDIERRVLKALTGFGGNAHRELKSPSIIVADDLTPSETVQLPREYVLGFATNGGSTTSHVALLARALAIPAVSGLGDITARVKPGQTMLLDGTNGTVTLNPDIATQREFADLIERQLELAEAVVMGPPAGTFKDGGKILLYANVHPGVPLEGIRENGARGIGLYRSEYLWLHKELEPTEEEQFAAYSEAARFAGTLSPDGAAVIRVLDIGGDKLVRGISSRESNPFLGNRSIRYLLSHRDVMKTQLRAILRASRFGHIKIMYPMVSCVEELREASFVLAEVKSALDAEGMDYDRNIEVGAMVEVPAAALNAAAIAAHVDFLSIGTNDLVQYTMAADRGNEAVAHLYQPFNPGVLKLMRMTIDAAKRKGIKVSVCGESAADPIAGLYWAALGVDMLSMSSTYIPLMSKMMARIAKADLAEYARVPDSMPEDSTALEIHDACHRWLQKKIPGLDGILI